MEGGACRHEREDEDVIFRQDAVKIGIGAAAALLLGWALHGPLGQGEAFMADLGQRVETALVGPQGAPGAGAVQPRGAAMAAMPAAAGGEGEPDRAARAVHGVRDAAAGGAGMSAIASAAGSGVAVVPAGLGAGSGAGPGASPSVAACQQGVDAALAGRAVQFRDGSAWLSPQSRRLLADVAAALGTCDAYRLEVGGHGNGVGLANRTMAEERARRVRAALIDAGVPAEAVVARGYGAARPLDAARPTDPANRRVSFSVVAGGV